MKHDPLCYDTILCWHGPGTSSAWLPATFLDFPSSSLAPSVWLVVVHVFPLASYLTWGLERPITAQHPGVSCPTATLGVSPGWRSATPCACAAQGAFHSQRAAGRPWRPTNIALTDLPNLIWNYMIWFWISHTHRLNLYMIYVVTPPPRADSSSWGWGHHTR